MPGHAGLRRVYPCPSLELALWYCPRAPPFRTGESCSSGCSIPVRTLTQDDRTPPGAFAPVQPPPLPEALAVRFRPVKPLFQTMGAAHRSANSCVTPRRVFMGWLRRFHTTWSQRDDYFEEERRCHLDPLSDRYVRDGMTPDEARRAALRRFGNGALIRERTLDVDMFRWLDDLRRDAAYAARLLLRNPGFSLLAILCLTLGIGANAAVFSWIEGILLRPYPLVVGQDRLEAAPAPSRGSSDHSGVSWPDWLDMQRESTSIDAFIAERITGTTLSI